MKKYTLNLPEGDKTLGSCTIGNPVDPGTGNKHQVEEIIRFSSINPINLDLFYSTTRSERWRHSYHRSVIRVSDLQKPIKSSACPSNKNQHESSGGFGSAIEITDNPDSGYRRYESAGSLQKLHKLHKFQRKRPAPKIGQR